jgi:hypothetical protein
MPATLGTVARLARELHISPAQLLQLAREASQDLSLDSVNGLTPCGAAALLMELRSLERRMVSQ